VCVCVVVLVRFSLFNANVTDWLEEHLGSDLSLC